LRAESTTLFTSGSKARRTFACRAIPVASRTQATMSFHDCGRSLSGCLRHMLFGSRVPVQMWMMDVPICGQASARTRRRRSPVRRCSGSGCVMLKVPCTAATESPRCRSFTADPGGQFRRNLVRHRGQAGTVGAHLHAGESKGPRGIQPLLQARPGERGEEDPDLGELDSAAGVVFTQDAPIAAVPANCRKPRRLQPAACSGLDRDMGNTPCRLGTVHRLRSRLPAPLLPCLLRTRLLAGLFEAARHLLLAPLENRCSTRSRSTASARAAAGIVM